MNIKEFWKLIESSKSSNQQDFLDNLKKQLYALDNKEIILFEEILRELIIKADHYNVMAAEKIIEGWVSDDPYLYFRCCSYSN